MGLGERERERGKKLMELAHAGWNGANCLKQLSEIVWKQLWKKAVCGFTVGYDQ